VRSERENRGRDSNCAGEVHRTKSIPSRGVALFLDYTQRRDEQREPKMQQVSIFIDIYNEKRCSFLNPSLRVLLDPPIPTTTRRKPDQGTQRHCNERGMSVSVIEREKRDGKLTCCNLLR